MSTRPAMANATTSGGHQEVRLDALVDAPSKFDCRRGRCGDQIMLVHQLLDVRLERPELPMQVVQP